MLFPPPPRLVLATHNQGKLEEIRALLDELEVCLETAADHGLEAPEETEDTYLGNARLKARAVHRATGLPALADDSGFEVDALGGRPGVYTADWAETPDGRDYRRAMERVWDELEGSGAPHPRRGRFRCTLVLAWDDGGEAAFDGSIEGRCAWPPRGDQGHGFDPMFCPDGYETTFGQMDRWKKNRINHRGRAFDKLLAAWSDSA